MYFTLLFLSCILSSRFAYGLGITTKSIQDEYFKNPQPYPEEPMETPDPKAPEAYAFLYCSRPEFDKDLIYLTALKIDVYRLKFINDHYDPKPKDIIVFVCTHSPQWQIDLLKTLGVIVLYVDPIIPKGKITDNVQYIDQFTKLQLWRLTKWERVFYLDIDSVVNEDVIKIWDEPSTQIKTTPPDPSLAEYYPYLFAAGQDIGCRQHWCDPNYLYFNAGIFVINPSMNYFKRLIKEMNENDNIRRDFMEQDMFNSFYHKDGKIPVSRLPNKYNLCASDPVDYIPDAVIMHGKYWENPPSGMEKGYIEFWDDYDHIFEKSSKPLSLKRIYTPVDEFYINSTNKEAYAFLLKTSPEDLKEQFMVFEALKLTIRTIKDIQKEASVSRDIIVFAVKDTPHWQLEELQNLGALVFRIKKGQLSEEYLKLMFWKLVNWERVLYIDNDIFINKNSFINIWNEPSTQIQNQKQQDYKQSLFNVPNENLKSYYPYLFSAVKDPDSQRFSSKLFMIKPCIRHYQYLLSLLDSQYNTGEENLLNYAYNSDSPIPFSSLDSSYNTKHSNNMAPINEIKASSIGQLWNLTPENEKNPCVQRFWDSFHKSVIDQNDDISFTQNGCSKPDLTYIECPIGASVDSDQCKALSNECVSCFNEPSCQSCQTGFGRSAYYCTASTASSNNIIGYCSPNKGGLNYVAKGSFCTPTPPFFSKNFKMTFLGVMIGLWLVGYVFFKTKQIKKQKYKELQEPQTGLERIKIGVDSDDSSRL